MDGGGDREQDALLSSNGVVIREVYDSNIAHRMFAMELERALYNKCSVIVIEPTQLGDVTARWISVGNCLHKTAVIFGIITLVTGLWSQRPIYCIPFGTVSFICTGLYTVSWQFDPCVKYQVERDPRRLARIPLLSAIDCTSPVVLVKKSDTKRKILHCTMSLLSVALCTYRIYRSSK